MEGFGKEGRSRTIQAVFIRAPEIVKVGPLARAVATLEDGRIVAARQGRILGIAFHPEITGETGVHRWLVAEATAALG